MKKSILLILALSLILVSCERSPVASFVVSEIDALVTEDILFTNTSLDASEYEWDFGDGTYANAPNVSHSYSHSGDYDVRLTVWSRNGNKRDMAYQSITIRDLNLEVEVMEWWDGYPDPGLHVSGLSILAYPTYDDWLAANDNWVEEAISGDDGYAVFYNLKSGRRYYLDIWGENHDNYTLASEDVGFIETDLLVGGIVNYFPGWVDYYPPQKGLVNKERSRVLRAEPRGRKATDKPRKSVDTEK